MYNTIKTIAVIYILLSVSLISYSQEYESLLGFDQYTNPEILVITNRLSDQEGLVFINQVDTINPLKVFSVTYNDSSFSVVPTTIKSYINSHQTEEYVVFVHGDGKTFLHAAVRGLDIQNTYGVQVIVFAWPSRRDDGKVFNNFSTSLDNLKLSEGHFVDLIDSMALVKESCWKNDHQVKMSIFLHSLGNEYLPQYVAGKKNHSHPKLFNNLVINAAAVNSKDHYLWVENLDIQEQIFVNSNAKDLNLNGLRIISAYSYLMGELLLKPLACNATYVNFSEAIGFKLPPGRSHTYYIGEHVTKSEHVRSYYSDLFHGKMPDFKNPSLFFLRSDGYGYNIIY